MYGRIPIACFVVALAACGGNTDASSELCPDNRAAQLLTTQDAVLGHHFQWYVPLTETTLATDEQLVIRFALIPFSTVDTVISLTESGGRSAYVITFADGTAHGVAYEEEAWNVVEARYRASDQSLTVAVDGEINSLWPPSTFADNTIEAFRIDTSNDGTQPDSAWIDGISVQIEAPDGTSTLWAENFESRSAIDPDIGGVDILEPTVVLGGSMGCDAP